eukprot:scaffold193885_cov39-Tisochrysis_lutea.AAC.3
MAKAQMWVLPRLAITTNFIEKACDRSSVIRLANVGVRWRAGVDSLRADGADVDVINVLYHVCIQDKVSEVRQVATNLRWKRRENQLADIAKCIGKAALSARTRKPSSSGRSDREYELASFGILIVTSLSLRRICTTSQARAGDPSCVSSDAFKAARVQTSHNIVRQVWRSA